MEWTEVETGGPVVQMDLRNDLSVFPSSAGTATFARNGIATFRRGDALGQVAADQARFEDEGVKIEGEARNYVNVRRSNNSLGEAFIRWIPTRTPRAWGCFLRVFIHQEESYISGSNTDARAAVVAKCSEFRLERGPVLYG